MNKILKTISFLLLSVCFMLNVNVAHADCNAKKTVTRGDIRQVFIPHNELVAAANSEKDAREMTGWICSAISSLIPSKKIVKIFGSIGLLSSFPKLKSEYERWLEKSTGCGVVVTYHFQHHPGGYYPGGGGTIQSHDSWDFSHVEPQR